MAESQALYRVQILRGTEAANNAYTGPEGELTIDSENWRIRLHDGVTAGGAVVGNAADIDAVRTELINLLSDRPTFTEMATAIADAEIDGGAV